jgi:uncharacterized protein YndB with AHSA1/START domain
VKFDLVFEETYSQPPHEVWAALTDARALSAWLNEMDGFEPRVGCRFRMLCNRDGDLVDVYQCEVLEFEPPRRMVWSWLLEQAGSPPPTRVEYRVEPAPGGGTRLEVRHSGDRPAEVAERFRDGWPSKLAALRETLGAPVRGRGAHSKEETR